MEARFNIDKIISIHCDTEDLYFAPYCVRIHAESVEEKLDECPLVFSTHRHLAVKYAYNHTCIRTFHQMRLPVLLLC